MNRIQTPLTSQSKDKRSRGGTTKPPLEIARVRLWGLEVKSRTSLTYKALDELFLRKNPDKEFDEPPKVFEKIARNGVSPLDAEHRRGLIELIKVVDQHPDFQGTAIVFNSKLWELFELKSISEAEVLKRIDEVFVEHGVERRPYPAREESWRVGRNPDLDIEHPVNPIEMMRLQNANLHKITWDYLSILFYFFTRTTILRNDKRMFDIHTNSLQKYFEESLGDLGRRCVADAFSRIRGVEVVRVF